jgi:beta-fructofuranosidase
VLDRASDWVWDFWLADDGTSYHVFFLQAPRSLGDPDRRHHNARVGHATSADLVSWDVHADALEPGAAGEFDDLAVWTGSVVRDDDGRWRMFYTGLSSVDDGRVQRIGAAASADLHAWSRTPAYGLREADPRFYERRHTSAWPEEAWRDPFVLRDEKGTWHAYVTARSGSGDGLGVVGHATSPDLETWTIGPPLSEPTGRFEWLEVISMARVQERWVLLFSCLSAEIAGEPTTKDTDGGGVWSVPVDGPGTRVDVEAAVRLTSEDLYVGKVVRDRSGAWQLLAFENRDASGGFVGGLIDPVAVGWNTDGTGLELQGGLDRWRP